MNEEEPGLDFNYYADPKHVNRMPGTNPLEVTNQVQWHVRKALGKLLLLAEKHRKTPKSRAAKEWKLTSDAIAALANIVPTFRPHSEKRLEILKRAVALHPKPSASPEPPPSSRPASL